MENYLQAIYLARVQYPKYIELQFNNKKHLKIWARDLNKGLSKKIYKQPTRTRR